MNVFPDSAVVTVDCRLPVGWTERRVTAEIEAALAGVDARWRLEYLGTIEGNASPADTPMRRAVDAVMTRLMPGARVVPLHCAGFTDSNWFRAAFPDIVAYNFAPFVVDDVQATAPRFHNADERINVRDLAFQSLFAYELVKELLAQVPRRPRDSPARVTGIVRALCRALEGRGFEPATRTWRWLCTTNGWRDST